MICWLRHKVEVGKKYRGIFDINNIYHDQPVLVTREATAEEYAEEYKKVNNGKLGGSLKDLEGLYFYEVITD